MVLKMKKDRKEYKKTVLRFFASSSKTSNGTKAKNTIGKNPISGQANASNKPDERAKTNLFIIDYKYYHIFADMNAIKRNIPNTLTLSNLTAGLLAILFGVVGHLELAALCVFVSALFDFFDGLVARLLSANSELGKQLDSLADLVSFGVAPGMILFQLIHIKLFDISFAATEVGLSSLSLALAAFLLPIFSAIRLAKFNLDIKQSTSFIGLPTPAAAIFVASLPLLSENYFIQFGSGLLIGLAFALPILLVAKLPLFSLKLSKQEQWKTKENIIRIIFLISAVILLIGLGYDSIPIIVILYLILSLLNNL